MLVTGDCIYDTFTVTAPGSSAPPVICGYNTGQHMSAYKKGHYKGREHRIRVHSVVMYSQCSAHGRYVPSSALCNHLVIAMDPGLQHTRRWHIRSVASSAPATNIS